MDRIDDPTAEADKFGSGKDGFTEGDPGLVDRTIVRAAWLDAVQEELVRLIEEAGLTPDGNDYTQVRAAIRQFAANYDTPVTRTMAINMADGQADSSLANPWVFDDGNTQNWQTTDTNNAKLVFPLPLPSGVTISELRVWVDPGGTAGRVPMEVKLRSRSFDFGTGTPTVTTIVSDVSDGTANGQLIEITGIATLIDRSDKEYFIEVLAGTDGTFDAVMAAEVEFSDPGQGARL